MSGPARHTTHFDTIAGEYDRTLPAHVRDHYLKRRLALIAASVGQGRVLDVGCGTGLLAGALGQRGLQMVGVDDSREMMRASTVEPKPLFVQGLAYQLPFRTGTLDGTVSVAMLHHLITREAVAGTIREMARITRSGGVVILWDHNPLNPYWPVLMRKLPQDAGGYRLVSLQEILRTVRQLPSVSSVRVIRTGIIPDFLPAQLLPLAQRIEQWLERTPLLRKVLAHNVVMLSVQHPTGAAHVAR